MIKLLVFSMMLALPTVSFSDEPALTDVQQLKLQGFEKDTENLRLKAALIQMQLADIDREARAFFTSLQVEGYVLQRNDKGMWEYVKKGS